MIIYQVGTIACTLTYSHCISSHSLEGGVIVKEEGFFYSLFNGGISNSAGAVHLNLSATSPLHDVPRAVSSSQLNLKQRIDQPTG